jgi:Cof subfamily protein (haloacid dehalogenase superfamily)
MVQPELIAIDLDGTLLVDHHHISEENIAAIRKAASHGIAIYLVSGRAIRGMQMAAEVLGLTTPLISLNGAFIFDAFNNKIVYSQPIPRKLANRAIALFEHKGIYIGYHTALKWFVDKDCAEMRAEGKSMDREPEFVNTLMSANIPAPHKLIAIDFEHEDLLQIAHQELYRDVPDLNAHFSETFALEIFNSLVSKGKALQYIAESKHIPAEKIMVIGDNYNDISMMEIAGLSVAMGNAPSDVKSRADWIAPENTKNGVAFAIERLFT